MKVQILALVAVSALLAGCSDSDDVGSMNNGQMKMNYQMPTRGEATAAPMGGTFLNEPLPADVLAVQLVDQSNHKFKLSDLKGKTLVITNFLTSCQEICPMTTVNMRDIAASVDACLLYTSDAADE